MKRYYLFDEHDELLLYHDGKEYTLPRLDLPDEASFHAFSADEVVGRVSNGKFRSSLPAFPEGHDLFAMPLRATYRLLSPADYQRAGKAWELLYWSDQTAYCGRCGTAMQWATAISRRCPQCGGEIWPQLNTAIIVLVHKGDEALLVKAKTFRRNFFGLVAGFVETGESLEECVEREVFEETSLRITNIRYFGSQPWPYPLGLMIGFHADYVSGDIRFADGELADGGFFRPDDLPTNADGSPAIPGTESMARRLINDWMEE